MSFFQDFLNKVNIFRAEQQVNDAVQKVLDNAQSLRYTIAVQTFASVHKTKLSKNVDRYY